MILLLSDIKHETKTSQNGKEYTSCQLIVWSDKEQKNIWFGGFGSPKTKTWQAGDSVDVDIEQTQQNYWNFSENQRTKASPTALDVLKEISAKLSILIGGKKEIKEIAQDFNGIVTDTIPSGHPDEIQAENLPF